MIFSLFLNIGEGILRFSAVINFDFPILLLAAWVETRIGKEFYRIIEEAIPPSHPLRPMINRNTLKTVLEHRSKYCKGTGFQATVMNDVNCEKELIDRLCKEV